MNKSLRPKKLALKPKRSGCSKRASFRPRKEESGTTTVATIIFSEGACEGYSWLLAC
jgi:hypothetical protein